MADYLDPSESFIRVLSGLRGECPRHLICGFGVLGLATKHSWEPVLRPTIRVLRYVAKQYHSVWHWTGYPQSEEEVQALPQFQYSLYYRGDPADQTIGRQAGVFIYDRFFKALPSPVNSAEVSIRLSDKALEQGLCCGCLAIYFAPVDQGIDVINELLACERDMEGVQSSEITNEWLDRVLHSFSGVIQVLADGRICMLCCKSPVTNLLDEVINVGLDTILLDPSFASIRHRVRWSERELGFVLS